MIENIRIHLILKGILPATDEFINDHKRLKEKYNDILDITHVYHENKSTQIIYNKKFKKIIKECQNIGDNHKEFGKILGYTYLYDLLKETQKKNGIYNNEVLSIVFKYKNKVFLSYWKPINKPLTNEYKLLNKMRKIIKDIELTVIIEFP